MKNKNKYKKKIEKISKIAKLDDANHVTTDLKQHTWRTNRRVSPKKLTLLMRKILEEKYHKQQKHLLNIISGNFELSIKKIKNLKRKINDRRYTKNVLER